MRLCGAILAGGKSVRMGHRKEGVILPDGRAMIEHVAAALHGIVDELVISGDCAGFDPKRIGAAVVPDLRAGEGPLVGIEALLHSGHGSHYLIIACDQPLAATSILRRLLPAGDQPIGFRTGAGESLLPLPCLLPATLAGEVKRALDMGERSPRRWLGTQAMEWREISTDEARLLASFNTPEEVGRLRVI